MNYTLSMKEGFLSEWLALPAKEQAQVGTKLKTLTADPRPDGSSKKQLKHLNRQVNRLRSGDYRIFYTFDDRFVSLLKLVRRSEDTYDDSVEAEYFGGPNDLTPATPAQTRGTEPRPVGTPAVVPASRPLPVPVTSELLTRLHVPTQYHASLAAATDEDGLLGCAGVPDDILLRVHTAVFERPLEVAFGEKELVAGTVDELFRYRDGDLLGFLLRLSTEQEKVVSWALDGTGPTLVKGGPGTGKSTVALYRVRAVLDALRRSGVVSPRILFTTYTNALVAFSEQLLRSLLGEAAQFVEVRTADSLALSIVSARSGPARIATQAELREALDKATKVVVPGDSSLTKRTKTDVLKRIGTEYLLEEIGSVIEGRRLRSFDAYRDAKRPGRRIALSEDHRHLVWSVKAAFDQELKRLGKMSFQQVRSYAAQLVEQSNGPAPYDAVVIDEAQDLDPSLLWILVSLVKTPNRVFLTADADQSIYGAGFRWADVHEQLSFKGRTAVLRANFRSTREIGEAARAYISDGKLDEDEIAPEYAHSGPLPIVRHITGSAEEIELLSRFFRKASRELRLPLWAGALLAPTEKASKRLAEALTTAGVPASFMTGRDLDLTAQVVKVITLRSAKGLEFPFVALAGFEDPYPYVRPDALDEERVERTAQERRTLFVGMTRAMRALLLSVPNGHHSELLTGIGAPLWNTDVQ